jgi:hypothetical protein
MHSKSKALFTFNVRVDADTEKLRRRLQRKFECNGPELIRMALRELELRRKGEHAEQVAA